jgi:predicted membrane channel-forming protein YqfA (hemolysin III family)
MSSLPSSTGSTSQGGGEGPWESPTCTLMPINIGSNANSEIAFNFLPKHGTHFIIGAYFYAMQVSIKKRDNKWDKVACFSKITFVS